jgi:AhpD family alkylhydroperoxidase
MKKILMACAIVVVMAATAYAGDPPQFMKDTYPEQALKGAWEEYRAVWSPNGAIPLKQKHLIGLGVAAQIPCEYCEYYVYAQTIKAKQAGATEAEIKEAIAVAALVRKWSTVLNGSAYDLEKLKAELGSVSHASK